MRSAADKLRADLTANVAADITAFGAVMRAYKLPQDSTAEAAARDAAIAYALHSATAVPLRVARDATNVLGLAAIVAEKGNLNALSDAGSAAHLALAAARTAALNVLINAAAVKDQGATHLWLEEIAALEGRVTEIIETVNRIVRNRMTPGT